MDSENGCEVWDVGDARLDTGTVGSNLTHGMNVCPLI
jgi:hypothetical protein